MKIVLQRAYEPPDSDGCRVLVDAIWPRGVSRDDLRLDAWLRELAPSADLRRWFGHDPDRWESFRQRYHRELDQRPEAVARLRELADGGRLVLVYGARETRCNNAVALRDYLLQRSS